MNIHRDFTKGFAPTVTVTREELSELRALAVGFHATKQIRAWAADENVETRRSLVARIDALADRQS